MQAGSSQEPRTPDGIANERMAMRLALAGFIPFIALTLWLAGIDAAHPWRAMTILLLKGYGAVILSFLGGIRWGIATRDNDAATTRGLLLSVIPSLAGWVALALPDPHAFALLAAGFAGQGAWDQFAVNGGRAPDWFGRLRMRLTLLVVPALIAAVWLTR